MQMLSKPSLGLTAERLPVKSPGFEKSEICVALTF